eukprot:CAMPEP_0113645010 /NCGR_PEP_ID=MMETSP0017_2-20120614/23701_1 /TAXON_ID=2856 /ORGANISM="Cylindrotheca closterium" /LENGTH=451 /DNA_ID=CAMNT_0000556675 /DNA_START=98 /DNA_END=1450 /DNA_ORIENTATION=- /assembly_acc=CAM_ASM_000147
MDDPYQVLGLSHGASESEINKAYRKTALKYHLDRLSDKERDQEFAETISSNAYETLTNPAKLHDLHQKHESGKGKAPKPKSHPLCDSTPVSNMSKRAVFMAKKLQAQHESTGSHHFASPVNMRRKRQVNLSTPASASPGRASRSSVQSSPRRAASTSPSMRKQRGLMNGSRVNMDGSVHCPVVNPRRSLSVQNHSQRRGRTCGHSMAQASSMSPGTRSAHRRSLKGMSHMPEAPLSAQSIRRALSLSAQMQRAHQGPLPVWSTTKGSVLRQSVGMKAAKLSARSVSPRPPSEAPKSMSPPPLLTGVHHSTGQLNFEPGQRWSEASKRQSTKPTRQNFLWPTDGSYHKKKESRPMRKKSLDGTHRRKKKEKTHKGMKRSASQPTVLNVGKEVHDTSDKVGKNAVKKKDKRERSKDKKSKKKEKTKSLPSSECAQVGLGTSKHDKTEKRAKRG